MKNKYAIKDIDLAPRYEITESQLNVFFKVHKNLITPKDRSLNLNNFEMLDLILSKLGKRLDGEARHHIRRAKYSRGYDTLIHNKDRFLELAQNQYRLGDTSPKSTLIKYVGVEIECFIPYESLDLYGENYESGRMIECSACEGSGVLEYENRDTGHTIESDCQSCGGSGETELEESNKDQAIHDARSAFKRLVKTHKIKGLNVKEDGSLETDDSDLLPLELTIIFPQNDFKMLEKLCSLLETLGARVNASCGLHVHLDSRHVSFEELENTVRLNFASCLGFLADMVPESRRNNRYCKLQVSSSDRYSAVNLEAYEKYKTVEIRLHSATTNYLKIKHWITILLAIYNAERPLYDDEDRRDFFKLIKADTELKKYILERTKKFSSIDFEETDYKETLEAAS